MCKKGIPTNSESGANNDPRTVDEYWHNDYQMCYRCDDSVDGFGD